MKPTKILFLDIDGVLNSRRSLVAFDSYPHSFGAADMEFFDKVAIALVRRLCEVTNCSVVLSSDWRYDGECGAHEAANGLDLPIIDVTPMLLQSSRGQEIAAWLSEHPDVTTYAIVDDMATMLPSQQARFVQTDELCGLSLINYVDLRKILGEVKK